MPQKKKKDKKNNKLPKKAKRDKTPITVEMAESMFQMYVDDHPLTDIAKKFNISFRRVTTVRDRDDWKGKKEKLKEAVDKKSEKLICDSIIYDKKKRVEALENLFESLLEYSKKLSDKELSDKELILFWTSMQNIEKLYKLMYLEMNDGVSKSETSTTGTVEVREIKEVIESKDKAAMLRLIRGGSKQK